MKHPDPVRVLFVCLGNICRSPCAEGTFAFKVEEQNLESRFFIDSAGTSAWHIGERANKNSRLTAQKYGISLDSRARQFTKQDFDDFDIILAMDHKNQADILNLASNDSDRKKVKMMRAFDSNTDSKKILDVPDPYYGGSEGFEEVQKILLDCCENLVDFLRLEYQL